MRGQTQLTGRPLDSKVQDESAILQALSDAAAGKTVLLIIDDAWEVTQVRALGLIWKRPA